MCGRFTLLSDLQLLEKIFGVTMLPLFVEGAGYYVVAQKRSR